jgi:uncharacterized membrane protein
LGVPAHSVALGINESGQVTGNSSSGPFFWDKGTWFYLPSSGTTSAWGINDNGHIAYYSGPPHGFLWNGNTAIDIGGRHAVESQAIIPCLSPRISS